MSDVQPPAESSRVFRLSRLAYLAVLFVFFGVFPFAFSDTHVDYQSLDHPHNGSSPIGWQTTALVIPALVAVFIARWATIVDDRGITVRALFGRRVLPWTEVRGISVEGRTVYAVTQDGTWRLPCVHVADLAALSRASGGRLPEIAEPKPKFAPQRRRRR